jgi:hypothetical protein
MKITTVGELREKLNQGYIMAGENDEGELEWFFPTRKSAGEKLAYELEEMGRIKDKFFKEADEFISKLKK